MSFIIPTSQNGYQYAFTITNNYLKYCWVKNLYKKKPGLSLKKFVTFINNQTDQKLKCLKIN